MRTKQEFCNSFRGNHYIEGSGSNYVDSPDEFPYDNISQSSYGSHKNRNFESRSHRGSLDELRNQEENEKLGLLMMNGSGKKNGILSKGIGEKPHRSVVIDDEDIDAYSPDYAEDEDEEDEDSAMDEEDDQEAGLLDEEEARLRWVLRTNFKSLSKTLCVSNFQDGG